MANFEEIVARLPKEHRERVRRAVDISPERLLTPSLNMNLALGGGLGYGRIVTIWGTKSAGKTAFALQCVAEAQQNGKVCAFIDVEGTYESKWAEKLGVNTEELLHTYARSTERVTNVAVEFIRAGVDVIVVDSTSAMAPGSYMEGEELKEFSKTGQIGASARDLGKMLLSVNTVNMDRNAMVILIAQGRMAAVSSQHWGLKVTGGKAIEYYSSQVIKLTGFEGKDNFITDSVFKGDVILEEVVGRNINWKVEFNKLGPQHGTGSYDFYFQGDIIGVDSVGEVVDAAIKYQVLKKAGAWLKYGDEKWNGRAQMIDAVRDDPDLLKKLEAELYERI